MQCEESPAEGAGGFAKTVFSVTQMDAFSEARVLLGSSQAGVSLLTVWVLSPSLTSQRCSTAEGVERIKKGEHLCL